MWTGSWIAGRTINGCCDHDSVSKVIAGSLPMWTLRRKEESMDNYNSLPIGFGMALAMNPPAFNAYSNLTEEEKDALIQRAHHDSSQEEMHDIVAKLCR